MADFRWLQRRAQGWYCVKEVPRPLQAIIGKRRLVKSLGTRDLKIAQARRHLVLSLFDRKLAAAAPKAVQSPVMKSAAEWRALVTPMTPEERDESLQYIVDEAERIEEQHDPAIAKEFFDFATGKTTPLLHFVDQWLTEGGSKGTLRERTQLQYRSDLSGLEAWLVTNKLPATIEAVDKKTAGRYVTGMVEAGMDRNTANRKISTASSYWRWLVKRAHSAVNPWQNQSLAKARINHDAEPTKRPFTDAEMLALLSGPADPELADAIHVGALSGMRIEEIYRLTVGDCAAGWFKVRRSKTPAGRRRLPIHSALTELIERRSKGKNASEFLFHEPGPEQPGRERSMAVSKRFGRYRRRLNVDDRADGRRQSRIDLHSLRRWFVTKARAGFDRAVVAAIVGHDTGNITDDVYSGGPDDGVRRACVESVRLPVVAQVAV